jgi:hypothetical protein
MALTNLINKDAIAVSLVSVKSLADLAARKITEATSVYLELGGRSGNFKWDNSNLSTEVTADTTQADYVAPATDTTGASGAWVRESNELSIGKYGTDTSGVISAVLPVQACIDSKNSVVVNQGDTLLINGIINAVGGGRAWAGIRGTASDGCTLKFVDGGRISIQNRTPGSSLGTDIWPVGTVKNVAIDSQVTGVSDAIFQMGPDANDDPEDIDKSSNGQVFRDVIAQGTSDKGILFLCTFVTKPSWYDVIAKDFSTAWHFYTKANGGASDIALLSGVAARSCSKAGISAYADTVNPVSYQIVGGFVGDNTGWGAAFISTQSKLVAAFNGTHFEGNGTHDNNTAANVTVENDSTSREPSQLLCDNSIVVLSSCMIQDGFLQVINKGILTINGGMIPSRFASTFALGDGTGTIILNGPAFVNPRTETDNTLIFQAPVTFGGNTNDRQYISGRMINKINKIKGFLNGLSGFISFGDPYFESGTNGLQLSGNVAPAMGANTDKPFISAQSLKVIFNASVGDINVNSIFRSVGTVRNKDYVAVSFFLYSDVTEAFKISFFGDSTGDNSGKATLNSVAGEWRRYVFLVKNASDSSVQQGGRIDIFPATDNGSTVYIQGWCCAKGSEHDVLPVLHGGIAEE